MEYRVLALVAALLLTACAKKDSGCATPATQASLSAFVNGYVREHLRVGGYDPIRSGLLKITRFEAFEAIRLDEERERTSCRAIVQFDVEGMAMPTSVEYDLLPSGGDDSDNAYDTVVRIELSLGAIGSRLNHGVLADLRKKEGAVHSLENLVERIRKVVAANASGTFAPSPFAEQSKVDLAAREAELAQTKNEVARILESLDAGRGGR